MRQYTCAIVALAALAASPAFADDGACPMKLTPELTAALGPPTAWLATGQTVHAPAGLTVVGRPVSYVIAFHSGADDTSPITELDYRLQGLATPFGSLFAMDVRKAFEKANSGSDCASPRGSCMIDYKGSAAGDLTGAELSEGNIAMPKTAHGDGLGPVKADFNLDGADPVFLACHYKQG